MRNIYIFIALLFLSKSINAQENRNNLKNLHESSVAVSTFYTKFLGRNFYGINFDAKTYVKPTWALGLNFSYASKNVAEDYSYIVDRPTVSFIEISFLNHFDVYKSDTFRFGFAISNGYGGAVLSDRAYTQRDFEGFEVPLTIARNNFYVLQVGTEMAIKLNKKNSKKLFDYYLKTDLKNRKVFGGSNFGNATGFNGLQFGLGVLFVFKN